MEMGEINHERAKIDELSREMRERHANRTSYYEKSRAGTIKMVKMYDENIRSEMKMYYISENVESDIRVYQYFAKKFPISRDGTFEDFQALYPEEEDDYEGGPIMSIANTALNHLERFIEATEESYPT